MFSIRILVALLCKELAHCTVDVSQLAAVPCVITTEIIVNARRNDRMI